MQGTPPLAQAMILAAGRGQRMRPLTDHTPKPLLSVQGRPLLEWHLQALARAGLRHVLINTGWLGAQIPQRLGTVYATAYGDVHLRYSREDVDFGAGIETAGGIARALPMLEAQFWLVAGDVFMPSWAFDDTLRRDFAASGDLAHLWLAPNPAHHPQGDFAYAAGRALPLAAGAPSYTYSTLALLRQDLFAPPWCDVPRGNPQGRPAPLGPLLRQAVAAGRVGATLYQGAWTDVGTPERLQALNADAEPRA